jgi:hypothetical protein
MTVVQTAIAVQTALYSALTAAVSGLTPVPGIYDSVPKGTAFPYVVIDAQQALDADALVARRDDVFFYLSVWSDYPGQTTAIVVSVMANPPSPSATRVLRRMLTR